MWSIGATATPSTHRSRSWSSCPGSGAFVDHLTLVGRLAPEPGRSHYRMPAEVGFLGLPHYAQLSRPWTRGRGHGPLAAPLLEAARRGRRGVAARAAPARARLRASPRGCGAARVVLGVRQDFPSHMRTRHPRRYDIRGRGLPAGGRLARAGAALPDGGRGAGSRPPLSGRRGTADSHIAGGRGARDFARGGPRPFLRRGSDRAQRRPARPREEPAAARRRARAAA